MVKFMRDDAQDDRETEGDNPQREVVRVQKHEFERFPCHRKVVIVDS
jgi:hypothetical protein